MPSDPPSREPAPGSGTATVTLVPESWREPLVKIFRAAAGRDVQWALAMDGAERLFRGRVPHPRHWPSSDDPCLLLPPAATDGVHVLAEMALHLRLREGIFFLARRKWYETEDLDWTRLGPGPLETRLTDRDESNWAEVDRWE